jgi:hypothetical protein
MLSRSSTIHPSPDTLLEPPPAQVALAPLPCRLDPVTPAPLKPSSLDVPCTDAATEPEHSLHTHSHSPRIDQGRHCDHAEVLQSRDPICSFSLEVD